MDKLVVMFPDYRGEATRHSLDFVERVKRVVPNAVLVPVLNGLSKHNLDKIAVDAAATGFQPVVAAEADGLLDTLVAGYTSVVRSYGGATVVRLDVAEHPPEAMPNLVQEAEARKVMVIGDLAFGPSTFRKGSVDEFAHLDLFPELYRQFTGGRLIISCAHGYQVFAPGTLPKILERAQKIAACAQEIAGEKIKWGFDGAMALGAVAAKVQVVVKPVAAESLRDRPRQKVSQQFRAALSMCLAARQLL